MFNKIIESYRSNKRTNNGVDAKQLIDKPLPQKNFGDSTDHLQARDLFDH
jgi:hypothetical protein